MQRKQLLCFVKRNLAPFLKKKKKTGHTPWSPTLQKLFSASLLGFPDTGLGLDLQTPSAWLKPRAYPSKVRKKLPLPPESQACTSPLLIYSKQHTSRPQTKRTANRLLFANERPWGHQKRSLGPGAGPCSSSLCSVTWKAAEKLSGSTAEISALFRDIPMDTQ